MRRFIRHYGGRFYRAWMAIGLLVITVLWTLLVAEYAATVTYRTLHGQISIAQERINDNGKTIGELALEVEQQREALASLQAVECGEKGAASATPSPSKGPGASPAPTMTPHPTSAPTPIPGRPTASPTLCLPVVGCVPTRLTAC